MRNAEEVAEPHVSLSRASGEPKVSLSVYSLRENGTRDLQNYRHSRLAWGCT